MSIRYFSVLTNHCVRLILNKAMLSDRRQGEMARLLTLGPTGTCHEWGDRVHGVLGSRGLRGRLSRRIGSDPRQKQRAFLVVDTFIHPMKAPETLRPREPEQPRTLGLIPATANYVDLSARDEVVAVRSRPKNYLPDATKRASPASNTSPRIRTSSRSSKRSAKSKRLGWSTEPRSASKAM